MCYIRFDFDLKDLNDLRNAYTHNPMIGYLNINFLRDKIINLRKITQKSPIDILWACETKIFKSFPDLEFKTDGYQFPPLRKDRKSKVVRK